MKGRRKDEGNKEKVAGAGGNKNRCRRNKGELAGTREG